MGLNCDSEPSFSQHSDFFPLGFTTCPTHLKSTAQVGAGAQVEGGAAVVNSVMPTQRPVGNPGQGDITHLPSSSLAQAQLR